MAFYDTLAKGLNWRITSNTDEYFQVVNGSLLLPNPNWLMYHYNYVDKAIEAIQAFRAGVLVGKHYDISAIDKKIVKDPEEGKSLLQMLASNYHTFTIDIETDNLTVDAQRNKLLCIGVAYESTKGISFLNTCFKDISFKEAFQKFTSQNSNIFIFHNGIFDRSRTHVITGMDLKIDEDTLLMHYCGINEHKGTHGLKELAQLYLGFPDWEAPLDDWKKEYCRIHRIKLQDFMYSFFPIEILASYNVVDCCATFQLHEVFAKLMRPISIPIYKKLVEASPYYADMISRGMLMDMSYWKVLRDKLEAQSEKVETELEDLCYTETSSINPLTKSVRVIKFPVTISSPKQLLAWLNKKYPFDLIESTDKNALQALSEKYSEDPALQKILELRKINKYLKTYVYGLYNRKDSQDIIHCEYKLHGTETGRLSSSNPNMQNIPRNSLIKSLFIARPGYTFLQMDYSQSELRVLAYVSQDEKLMQTYRDGRDLHAEMAKHIFKDKFNPEDKDQRMAAKIVNFGIPYGRTPGGVARQLKVDITTAKQYLKDWFAAAPKVKDYINKMHEMVNKDEQYYTVFGRTRHYYLTPETIHHAENQAVNFPISSTANDLTIHALVEIAKWLHQENIDAYIVNTVHDSIMLEVRPQDCKRVAEKCQYFMSSIPKKYLKDADLPFRADAEFGTCYGKLAEPDWGGDEDDEDSDD